MTVITDRKAFGKAVPILATDQKRLPGLLAKLAPAQARWAEVSGFQAAPHTHLAIPGAKGEIAMVIAGVRDAGDPWAHASLPLKLAAGRYALGKGPVTIGEDKAAFGWALGSYQFTRYRKAPHLRVQGAANYHASIGADKAALELRHFTGVGGPNDLLGSAEWKTTPGGTVVVELFAIGDQLAARVEGGTLVWATDKRRISGTPGVHIRGGVTDIEVINLDGLPEAEALKIAGVDEKGNDLRGKTGTAK